MLVACETLLLACYFIPAGLLLIFGLNLYYTLGLFMLKFRSHSGEEASIQAEMEQRFKTTDLPPVVTQIPLFNEYNVAERVLRAVAAMDYPAGRHTIQALDDSTDDTRTIVDRVAAELKAQGHDIQVIRRSNRIGFKAGALNNGMNYTQAQFFAIFDADFVPPRDFLKRTVAVMLTRPEVGVVQARWGHLNANQSFVTRAQGIGIDSHFAIEQPARAWNALFMNFNGTAGLWRRQAIADAGGWEYDTLTEDMDLSYRSQLAGWKPFFLFNLVVPAELPDNINAFKVQQFRWAKGSMQTAIKLLPRIFRSNFPIRAKIQSFFHMTHYMIHPLMVCVAVMALPMLHYTRFRYSTMALIIVFALLIVSTLAPMILYVISQQILYPKSWKRLRFLPFLTSLGIGIAISNSRAVFEAITGKQTEFVRTPKKGDHSAHNYKVKRSYEAFFEILLGVYCFATFFSFIGAQKFLIVPFLFLYAWGFSVVGILSMYHYLQANRPAKA